MVEREQCDRAWLLSGAIAYRLSYSRFHLHQPWFPGFWFLAPHSQMWFTDLKIAVRCDHTHKRHAIVDKANSDIIDTEAYLIGGYPISNRSNNWADAETFEEIGAITRQFDILECADCARAILQWLRQHGIPGKLLKLKTRYGEDYILSTRLEQLGVTDSITINGKHYGVEVYEKVFDNLSERGLSREEWLKDFKCHSGEFTLVELE